ncbi:hypothetical protein O9G_002140 [Rozella allomycis CSF55]|uniref:Uncharacterized protein n=1 Tax=Rozella allomycis (strain CSF55) TaxID=988480 RepID=A0A075AQ76_ROZAC|nr:hypothetical protein O9G_002140 [Rozella allomycis CSF55]|eukprot:EPZ32300.1 hypothetical protein O9G_002140 [Rozella allomycis CSF55]
MLITDLVVAYVKYSEGFASITDNKGKPIIFTKPKTMYPVYHLDLISFADLAAGRELQNNIFMKLQ